MRKKALILWAIFLVLEVFLASADSYAQPGKLETRRERRLREEKEGKRKILISSKEDYKTLEKLYLSGRYSLLVPAAEDFLKKYPQDQKYLDRARFLLALSHQKLHQSPQAEAQLDWLSKKSKDPGVREEALISMKRFDRLTPDSQCFTIQVGSFTSEKNAKTLMESLASKNYEAYLLRDYFRKVFRVRVGRFASRQEAVNFETRLKQEGYPTRIYP